MYLQMFTHMGLRLATYEALGSRLSARLAAIAKQCFGLDLQDPSELQVLDPQECNAVGEGKFVYWKLQDVLSKEDRQFAIAKAMINEALVEIFRDTEVPKDERFSVRGCIPHVGTFTNVTEDLEPHFFEGTRDLEHE